MFAQTSAYGHWANDPKNIATPGFVYDVPPTGFDPLAAPDAELERWGSRLGRVRATPLLTLAGREWPPWPA